jgi:hypothetical protein
MSKCNYYYNGELVENIEEQLLDLALTKPDFNEWLMSKDSTSSYFMDNTIVSFIDKQKLDSKVDEFIERSLVKCK